MSNSANWCGNETAGAKASNCELCYHHDYTRLSSVLQYDHNLYERRPSIACLPAQCQALAVRLWADYKDVFLRCLTA